MDHETTSPADYLDKVGQEVGDLLSQVLADHERLRQLLAQRESELRSAIDDTHRAQQVQVESAKLKDATAALVTEVHELKRRAAEAQAEIARLKAQVAHLEERIAATKQEHEAAIKQTGLAEKQNTLLAYHYATLSRLHGSLDRQATLEAIDDTLLNLVGAERFVLYELRSGSGTLESVSPHAGLAAGLGKIAVGEGSIGETVARGEVYVSSPTERDGDVLGSEHVRAVVPLRLEGTLYGAIVIFSLLPQKDESFDPIDLELFELLAVHAAPALYAARLHHHVTRAN